MEYASYGRCHHYCCMHDTRSLPKVGLHLINILRTGKMIVLAFVILAGIAAILPSVSTFHKHTDGFSTTQRNFSSIWSGSSTQPLITQQHYSRPYTAFVATTGPMLCLAKHENPVSIFKFAASIALSIVSAGYFLVNVACFCTMETEDFRASAVVAGGHFLTNVFGNVADERILPWLIILSAFENVVATSFAQARVNPEFGRSGLLPWSSL